MTAGKKTQTNKRKLPRWAWWVSIGALVLLLIGAYLLFGRPAEGQAPEAAGQAALPAQISVLDAYTLYLEEAFFLDVRTELDYVLGRIPNSVSIPLEQLGDRTGELPLDETIVLVCFYPEECTQAYDLLVGAGFTRATSMIQGVVVWLQVGYPFEGLIAN